MSNGNENALAAVPLRVENARRIPAKRYYDEEFFKLEAERLWPRVWQMACRLEEIPQVGDWVEYTILEKSVLIVRTRDGLKAYHNACRHRGVKLGSGHGNCAKSGFICPFHGWRWNMDGENTFVFGRSKFNEEDLDAADIALVPCRVETWGGCAFINMDDNAPPLRDCIGQGATRMDARNVADLKVEWWRSAILPVNWKLAMEAFMEGYHVPITHPQLHAISTPESKVYGAEGPDKPVPPSSSASSREFVDVTVSHMAKLREGMGGMIDAFEVETAEKLRDMDLPEDVGAAKMAFYSKFWEEVTRVGREKGLPVPDIKQVMAEHPFKAVEYFFPNYFLLPMYTAMTSYRVRPLTPETCLFEIWSLAHLPDDPNRPPPTAPEPTTHDDPSYPEIPRQDYSNLPIQQLGLHSKGFEYMRLAEEVEGLISNYQRLIDGYLADLPQEKLARPSSLASGSFDVPVGDIEL